MSSGDFFKIGPNVYLDSRMILVVKGQFHCGLTFISFLWMWYLRKALQRFLQIWHKLEKGHSVCLVGHHKLIGFAELQVTVIVWCDRVLCQSSVVSKCKQHVSDLKSFTRIICCMSIQWKPSNTLNGAMPAFIQTQLLWNSLMLHLLLQFFLQFLCSFWPVSR